MRGLSRQCELCVRLFLDLLWRRFVSDGLVLKFGECWCEERGSKDEEKINMDVCIEDKGLRGILFVERLPRDGRLRDGTRVVRLGMIGLVLVFKQLYLKGKVVGCQEESKELMYSRPSH